MADHRDDRGRVFSGRKVRGGEIILRTPLRKAVFIGGLAGAVVLAAILGMAGFW